MRNTFKRFYKDVDLITEPDGTSWRLRLDGTPAKSPGGRIVVVAHRTLAEAIATEWQAQGETANLISMPMTRLTMSVLDHIAPRVAAVRQEALAYGRTDLLCYRADAPRRLAERQAAIWQPYLDWAAEALSAPLNVTSGIGAISQDEASLAALGTTLGSLDPHRLLVASALTARFGSLVLALSVVLGHADATAAFEASRLDELFQAEIWGMDAEAEERSANLRREVEELGYFLTLLG